MRQRPTAVLVHGGPGVWDHSYFKPDFAPLAKHAQVIYLDLRGHGRSDWGDVATFSWPTIVEFVDSTIGRGNHETWLAAMPKQNALLVR